MTRLALPTVLVLVATMLGPTAATAGTTGAIAGDVVRLGTGAPLAGVKITATSATDMQTTHSDARGNFAFVSLAPGEYTLVAERDGFDITTARAVVVADETQLLKIAVRPAVTMIVHLDGPFTFYGYGMGVGPGRVADVYSWSAYRAVPASAPPIADLSFLRTTPGITFGAGAPVMH